ncbi:DUF134 domain-containing protein [Candidatus Bipolaricaulota bacterium]|nr:DUF134 domain-containing protein [Candidatus Bipolaricaulota bacterium]
MPRPPKPRRCWGPPPHEVFKPVGIPMGRLQVVQLALDELEALRLCDLLGLDQETAGMRMGVSRGTVQRLLSSARAKVADALVNGKALVIVRTPYVQFHRGAGPGPHRHRGPPP